MVRLSAHISSCRVIPEPKDLFFNQGEGSPDGSSNQTYRSAKGGHAQPVQFHQYGCVPEPKEPIMIQDERPE